MLRVKQVDEDPRKLILNTNIHHSFVLQFNRQKIMPVQKSDTLILLHTRNSVRDDA